MSVTNTTTSEPAGLLKRIFGRLPPPVVTVNIDLAEIRARLDEVSGIVRARVEQEQIAKVAREVEARVARETAIATQAEAERTHQAALAAMEERLRAATEQRARELATATEEHARVLAALAEQHARDQTAQQTALVEMRREVSAALGESREARKAAEEVIVEASASALGGVHELATRTAAVEEMLPKIMSLVQTIAHGHTGGNIMSHVTGDVVTE